MNNCTRRRWGDSVTPRPLFTPGKDSAPTVQEAGWAPVPVWTSAENLAPTCIRSPDRPARSHSLYRLRYPAHLILVNPDEFRIVLYTKHLLSKLIQMLPRGRRSWVIFFYSYHSKILQIFEFIFHLSSRDSMPQFWTLSALLNLT
jgi:hypothetical protein